MIDSGHKLPVVRQAKLLKLSRASVYYQPEPTPESDLALMRILDRWHMEYPFADSRMLRDMLRLAGHPIGRKRVSTLMRKMGIEALYRKANTSRRHPAAPDLSVPAVVDLLQLPAARRGGLTPQNPLINL